MPARLILSSINVVEYNERLVIILGFLTLIFMLATLFSCRSCSTVLSQIGLKSLSSRSGYRSFFKFHSFYWWGFLFSLILHSMVALMHLAYRDPADPDAYLHIYIFITGIAAFVITLAVYSSCRSFAALLNLVTGKNPLSGKVFTALYRFHNYHWLILIAIVTAHFTLAYWHTGVWVY